ncbi:hypothetical protein QJS66_08025 [Kocuria rhizophila]|nr:hypothetical protein QJS66_08025 [Kocuria rhizophila]
MGAVEGAGCAVSGPRDDAAGRSRGGPAPGRSPPGRAASSFGRRAPRATTSTRGAHRPLVPSHGGFDRRRKPAASSPPRPSAVAWGSTRVAGWHRRSATEHPPSCGCWPGGSRRLRARDRALRDHGSARPGGRFLNREEPWATPWWGRPRLRVGRGPQGARRR